MLIVDRSLATIADEHLEKLADIGVDVFDERYAKAWTKGPYFKGRLFLIALCQGGAQHYLDGCSGVKDLDVWGFFAKSGEANFPNLTRWVRDFGPSSLGRHPDDEGFSGRRVDGACDQHRRRSRRCQGGARLAENRWWALTLAPSPESRCRHLAVEPPRDSHLAGISRR